MAKKRWVLFILLILSSFPRVAGAADWPQWRGPDRDAISKEAGLLKSWPEKGPAVLWETPLGDGYATMSVAAGRVYTMYADNSDEYVIALDEKTGKPVWKVKLGPKFKTRPGPRSTPTVEGDLVYAMDTNGNLACLKTADGSPVWKQNILTLAGARPLSWGTAGSPYISGDMLLFNPGGPGASVLALNKKTGEVIWKSLADKGSYSTPVETEVGGVKQFIFLTGANVAGVAAKDGKPLWSYRWPSRSGINIPTPIMVEKDKVFVTTGYGTGCVLLQIVPGETFTVKEVWPLNKNLKSKNGNPILLDGYIYGCDESGRLICIDPKTGAQKWEQAGFGMGSLVCADGLFYIMSDTGTLVLARLTPEKFEKISELKIFPNHDSMGTPDLWTMPVVANGKLYVRDSHKIICMDVKAK